MLCEGPLIGQARYLAANIGYTLRVNIGNHIAISLGQLGDHLAPWVDNDGVTEGRAICAVGAVLRRCDYIALAFNSPRAQ